MTLFYCLFVVVVVVRLGLVFFCFFLSGVISKLHIKKNLTWFLIFD